MKEPLPPAAAAAVTAAAAALPPSTHLRLLALVSGLVGLQFCWAVQVGYVTKSLLELGLSARFVSYAWLAGPVAGIIVQPLVGSLSDRCRSRLGRRRPFLIAGTLVAAVCLLLFAFAAQIGARLGDPVPVPAAASQPAAQPAAQPRALAVAIAAFWTLDFAINAAQGPLRALLADLVPPHQHQQGNSYFALATGLGNCFGSLLGSLPLARVLTAFPSDLHALYSIAVVVLVVSMGVTVVCVKEQPWTPPGYAPVASAAPQYESLESAPHAPHAPHAPQHVSFFRAALAAPYPFYQVFTVQCFAWFGWFTMFVFGTSWVGAEVYNGRFDAAPGSRARELYDAGVREGNLGIALQSVLTIGASLVLPAVLRRFSVQRVYVAAHVLLGAALSCTLLVHQRWQGGIATGLLASTGFSWAVTMAVPWSLMSEAVAEAAPHLAGVYFTMFNLSQCFPEIAVSLVAEEVERVTGRQAAVLGLGGASVFVAALLTVGLRVGKPARAAAGRVERDAPDGAGRPV